MSLVSEVSVLGRRQGYVIYLYDFADALGIGEDSIQGKQERNKWSKTVGSYFRSRTDFPVKRGTAGRPHRPAGCYSQCLRQDH